MKKYAAILVIIVVAITIVVFVKVYFLMFFSEMDSEPQDISISTNIDQGMIIIDGLRVAKGEVCLPQSKQGEHVVKIEKDGQIMIEQKVDIGDVGWKVLSENKVDNNAELEFKLDNCKEWGR